MIEDRLRLALEIDSIEILDQSHLHIGHPGAASGAGHFDITVVSKDFNGLTRLACHRIIYEALDDLMNTDIHALSLKTLCPGEN